MTTIDQVWHQQNLKLQQRGQIVLPKTVTDLSLDSKTGMELFGSRREHTQVPVAISIRFPSQNMSIKSPQPPQKCINQQSIGTGVYFNNREVLHAMHPLQVRCLNQYTTTLPSLPAGKPMFAPPALVAQIACISNSLDDDTAPISSLEQRDANQNETSEDAVPEDRKRKRRLEDSEKEEQRPMRRIRDGRGASLKPLSPEQQVFLEAAFALSELNRPNVMTSPKTSLGEPPRTVSVLSLSNRPITKPSTKYPCPRSVYSCAVTPPGPGQPALMVLPPPPFLLPLSVQNPEA
jgi:hypothetical protein